MIKRKIKSSLRVFQRKPLNTLVNILGLSIGLACFVLAFLFIQYKFSFDRFHENSDRIARVIVNESPETENRRSAMTPAPLANSLKEMYPEIVKAASVSSALTTTTKFTFGTKTFHESHIIYTTNDFFDIFSYPFLYSSSEPLSEPNSIIISEKSAKKYFGNINPIGEVIIIRDSIPLKVTAVLKDVQQNSSLSFEFVMPLELFEKEYNRKIKDDWGWINFHTFLLLDKNVSFKDAEKKMSRHYHIVVPHRDNRGRLVELQPFNRLYLYSKNILYDFLKDTSGGIDIIYTIGAIAFFVLLLACINFMNMGTAQTDTRAKEIGIRKIFGSTRINLIRSLLSESLVQAAIAFFLAMVLVEIAHPYFNDLMQSSVKIDYLDWKLMGSLVLIALFSGLIAGLYPSVVLTSINPLRALQLEKSNRSSGGMIRKALVVFQFSISAGLIIVVLVVSSQVKYLLDKDLGYNHQNRICFIVDSENQQLHQAFKAKMQESVNVVSVSGGANIPMWGSGSTDGFKEWEGHDDNEKLVMNFSFVDYDYFETYEMKMVQGRPYSREFSTDLTNAIVVNEAAVKAMKMVDPIGKMVNLWSSPDSSFRGRIVGVVKDYHFTDVRRKIDPLMLKLNPNHASAIVIHYRVGKKETVKKYVEKNWSQFYGDSPLNIFFLDTQIEQLCQPELSTRIIMCVLTVIAIIISCLGLFALVLFTIQKRTKEIGIRKVLGATSSRMIRELLKEYVIFIVIANIIAAPIAYYFTNQYLQNYVYHINITFFPFFIALGVSLILAIVTILIHVYQAANSNPVDALKYE